MSLIHEPRCPQCGHELPMRTLWEFAKLEESYVIRGFGLLTDDGHLNRRVGITCPNCRADFRVTQARIRLVSTVIVLGFFLLVYLAGVWIRRSGMEVPRAAEAAAAFVAMLAVGGLLQWLTPYLASVRPPRPDEVMSFPLKNAYRRSEGET